MGSRRAPLSRMLFVSLVSAAAVLLAFSAAAPPPVVDLLLGEQRLRLDVAELAQRAALAPEQDFRVVELGRDAAGSHHAVSIRTSETPHRHDRHDLFVVVLSGHGRWLLGERSEPVGQGSVLHVPRGTVHAFTNESDEPALAYALYTPPFDGTDRVEVD